MTVLFYYDRDSKELIDRVPLDEFIRENNYDELERDVEFINHAHDGEVVIVDHHVFISKGKLVKEITSNFLRKE